MRRLHATTAAISAALCLGCAALAWFAGATGRAPARPAAAAQLRWEAGARQHYRVATEIEARLRVPAAARAEPMRASLSGVLELAVEHVGADGARARFRLAPASYASAGRERAAEIGLSTPFRVAFRADGLPLAFEFPPELAGEARSVLEELVRTFQVVVAGRGASWTAREESGTGAYLADYRAEPGDDALVKRKHGFESVRPNASALGALEVRLPRSEARVRVAAGASWLESVELVEEARFVAGGETVLESRLTATLARIADPAELAALESRARAAAPAARSPQPAPEGAPLDSAPPRDAGAELARLLAELERGEGKSAASVHALRDLVAARPEAARLACDALAAGALGDGAAAALVHALELAATPAAQSALGSILADSGAAPFGRASRLRAALALGGVREPTAEALDALWGAASLGGSDEGEELASTSLLALGALAAADRASAGETVGPVEARLAARLAASADEDERGILLGALGNARNPALESTVSAYLDDESAYVRASAADALGNLASPAVEALVAGRLDSERDPRVRSALASALRRVPEPSPESLALVRSLVLREESDSARVEMTRLLGEHADALPGARATLEELLRDDGSPRVRACAAEALLGS